MSNLSFNEQGKVTAKTHIDAKIEVLTDFLDEINEQGYTSIAQIRGSILSQIESVNKLRVNHD